MMNMKSEEPGLHLKDEIFQGEQIKQTSYDQMFWIKENFFRKSNRELFGTWNGVFTSIVLGLFSVIMYLRAGWMVANAGIILSIVVILISFLNAFITMSSAIG
jgi:hypothetical protein